jgi:hypothetical protein
MPVDVRWHDPEHTILYYRFSGKWTFADLAVALQETQTFERQPYVDIILNFQASQGIPMQQLHKLHMLRPVMEAAAWRVAVMVTSDGLIARMFRAFAAAVPQFGKRFVVAHSDEEALKLIAEVRR